MLDDLHDLDDAKREPGFWAVFLINQLRQRRRELQRGGRPGDGWVERAVHGRWPGSRCPEAARVGPLPWEQRVGSRWRLNQVAVRLERTMRFGSPRDGTV